MIGAIGTSVVGSLQAMGTTLRNFFRRANTVQYPKVQRPLPRQWRGGTFALTIDGQTDEENCIGCRLCEYICPSQIIRVTLRKGEKRVNGLGATYCDLFTLDYQACMQCELCIQVCPTDAIVMTRYLADCPTTRDGLFLGKEKLLEHGRALLARPEHESYATSSRLREWTDPARGQRTDGER
ncbi:MAG TPA: 4Fe-4S binding protein [Candidatus Polarisedimenticolaceae bacterium]|nr:4Fe-4S binding protein [Candidatus Polarisedimenticolaceae bacterium]